MELLCFTGIGTGQGLNLLLAQLKSNVPAVLWARNGTLCQLRGHRRTGMLPSHELFLRTIPVGL